MLSVVILNVNMLLVRLKKSAQMLAAFVENYNSSCLLWLRVESEIGSMKKNAKSWRLLNKNQSLQCSHISQMFLANGLTNVMFRNFARYRFVNIRLCDSWEIC